MLTSNATGIFMRLMIQGVHVTRSQAPAPEWSHLIQDGPLVKRQNSLQKSSLSNPAVVPDCIVVAFVGAGLTNSPFKANKRLQVNYPCRQLSALEMLKIEVYSTTISPKPYQLSVLRPWMPTAGTKPLVSKRGPRTLSDIAAKHRANHENDIPNSRAADSSASDKDAP
jgi:hypothetical protein